MRPGQELTKALAIVDEKVIDGAVRGVGSLTLDVASGVRKTQTGKDSSHDSDQQPS